MGDVVVLATDVKASILVRKYAEGVVVVSGTTDMYPRYIYVYTNVPGTTKVIYNYP